MKKFVFIITTLCIFSPLYSMSSTPQVPEEIRQKIIALIDACVYKQDHGAAGLALKASAYDFLRFPHAQSLIQQEICQTFLRTSIGPTTLLRSERAPSPLLMQLVRWGCEQMHSTQCPSIYYAEKPLAAWFAKTIVLNAFREVADKVLRPSLPCEIVNNLLEKPTILFTPGFDENPIGVLKLTILHELQRCNQRVCMRHMTIQPESPALFPRGSEQEADIQALLHSNCSECSREYVAATKSDLSPDEIPTDGGLSYTEAHTIINRRAETCCLLHQYTRAYKHAPLSTKNDIIQWVIAHIIAGTSSP